MYIMLAHREQREAFHFCFLEKLLKITDPRLYILKGGVNLRFFFNSPRYSEDMDIDVLGGAVATLKKNVYKILNDAAFRRSLAVYGIDDLLLNDPAKAKQTDTTQRFRLRLVSASGAEWPTKVEFSRRRRDKTPIELALIHPEIARRCQRLSFRCPHYPAAVAIAQKIQALADRKIVQARDVFDIYVLISGGAAREIPPRRDSFKDAVYRAGKNIDAMTYEHYRGQVLEFIDADQRASYAGEDVWESMKTEVLGLLS